MFGTLNELMKKGVVAAGQLSDEGNLVTHRLRARYSSRGHYSNRSLEQFSVGQDGM